MTSGPIVKQIVSQLPGGHIIRRLRHHGEEIYSCLMFFRGHRVIIDDVLARIYGVPTARLNQQFRRNRARFPADFAFELTKKEFESLMLQSATSKKGRGGRRKLPIAFNAGCA